MDAAITPCTLPPLQCFRVATRQVAGPIRRWRRRRSCSSCSKGSIRARRTPSCSGVSKLCTRSTLPTTWMVNMTHLSVFCWFFYNGAPFCYWNLNPHVPTCLFPFSAHVCILLERSGITIRGARLCQGLPGGHSRGQGLCQAVSGTSCQTKR